MIKVQGKIIKTEPIQGNLMDNIEGLIKVQEKTVTPIEETQDIIPDSSYDALSRVTVNKIPDDYIIPEGTLEITTNNLYNVKNYEKASVNIELRLAEKTITKNGVYNALDDSVDGYSQVTVDILTKFSSLVDRTITTITAEDLAGLTKIGDQAFNGCSNLISVTIPDSVTRIETFAFNNCVSLMTITIPDDVTYIGSAAFQGCRNLTSVTITATIPPTLASTSAFNSTNNCPIYVPAESVNAYKAASNWVGLASRIQAIPE